MAKSVQMMRSAWRLVSTKHDGRHLWFWGQMADPITALPTHLYATRYLRRYGSRR